MRGCEGAMWLGLSGSGAGAVVWLGSSGDVGVRGCEARQHLPRVGAGRGGDGCARLDHHTSPQSELLDEATMLRRAKDSDRQSTVADMKAREAAVEALKQEAADEAAAHEATKSELAKVSSELTRAKLEQVSGAGVAAAWHTAGGRGGPTHTGQL